MRAGHAGVLAALGLAVLAVLGLVLPDPIDLGSGDRRGFDVWNGIVLGVGGLLFLVLLVKLVGSKGRGPSGPRRRSPSSGIEVLGALGLFLLVPSIFAAVLFEALGRGLGVQLLAQSIGNVVIVSGLLVVWRRMRLEDDRPPLPAIRAESLGPDLLRGGALALAILPALNGATKLAGVGLCALGVEAELQPLVIAIRDEPSALVVAFAAFFTIVLAPLAEELVFRGFLFTGLRRYVGPFVAALSSAVVFAAIHGSAHAALPLLGLGLALALIYERSGSLAAPITLHATFNAVQFVGILLSPGGAG